MRLTRTIGLFACILFVVGVAEVDAALKLSNTLGSNMVLQRAPTKPVIWGYDTPNSKVTVSIQSDQFTAITGADGIFSVALKPYEAGGPYTIKVTSSEGTAEALTNVMFGDVYLCGGQSNMQFTVHSAFNATAEINAAAQYPQIRLFSVGTVHTSATPVQQLISYQLGWSEASPQTVGFADWTYFSAVCWFFGRDLADHFPHLPIGLISSNWGGTPVEAWSSPDALAKCKTESHTEGKAKEQVIVQPLLQQQNSAGSKADPSPGTPSVLWNAMIVPFLRTPIKGALWYQGEANAGDPNGYKCRFPAMIADWRQKWEGQTPFPFFFVQLAPWEPAGVSVAQTRQSQLAALALPNVGFATAADLGDIGSPFNNIHPRNKQEVSRRLLLAARTIAYGESGVVWQGPMAAKAVVASQAPNVRVMVTFNPNTLSGGLVHKPGAICPTSITYCAWYQIQLSDNKWYNATANVVNNELQVSVTATSGLQVKGVSYGWNAWPVLDLFNGAGLPAIPFEFML